MKGIGQTRGVPFPLFVVRVAAKGVRREAQSSV
jgi:hypothetical protein